MDIIGNEVTQRIRAAITNKLKEVGVYVDDELPDYIMVMVANKKSKEQMMSDLMLFLGTSTKSFTIWLHELLDNLQATTSVEPSKPPPTVKDAEPLLVEPEPPELLTLEKPPTPPPAPPIVLEEDNEEVITFQTDFETDDLLMQELQKEEMLSESQKPVEKKSNKISLKNPLSNRFLDKEPAPSKTSVKVRPIFHRKTVQSSVRRPPKYDSYYSNDEEESGEDKYDPRNPSVNSVASVVHVSQRKSSVPRSLQANQLLLFKAMEDANKSVSHSQRKTQAVHIEPYEPTPISKLKKPILRVSSQEVAKEALEQLEHISLAPEQMIRTVEDEELKMMEEEEELEEEELSKSKDIHVPVNSVKVPLMPVKRKLNREPVTQSESIQKNPRFVVTLDGVDPNEFLSPKSLRSVVSQRDMTSDEQELIEEEEEEPEFLEEEQEVEEMDTEYDDVPAKKAKLPVRCLKWPACHHGDACHFHHPKHHCKMFPNCSFGIKCLYIHPNCKYDSLCKKRDCPFTHAGKRKPAPQSIPICVTSEIIPVSTNVVCKFHPDCLNPSCTFFHPKNCKFGLRCKNSGCQFTHPVTSVASPHQLKWTAPKLSISKRKFSLSMSEQMPVCIDK